MTKNTEQQPSVSLTLKPQGGRSGGQELRIMEILHILLKRRMWIMLCAIFGVVFGLSLSVLSYVESQAIKQYTIKTSIALTSQSQNGLYSRDSREPNSYDFYLAEDMVDAAIYILMSDTMLDKIIEEANLLGVSAREIYYSMSMEQYRQTQIILINLYWENAAQGVKILEAMNRLAPQLLIETLKLGSVTVINNPTARFVIGGNLNLSRNLVLGTMVGLVLGAAVAVLELILRPTLLTISDVEKRLNIPLLGTIAETLEDAPDQARLLEKEDAALTRSEIADSYLALAYTLKRRLAGQEHPCLMITSSERGEGRTVVTACLAAALSQIGLRVLAVDFDFRNPMLGGLFFRQVDPLHTINALYQGKNHPKDTPMRATGTLDILPALLEREPMPMNDATMDLIQRLRVEYDIVLLDTPPVGQIADTMALNTLTDQALFVIQYDEVSQSALREALTRMESVEISVEGAIVNRVHRTHISFRNRGSGHLSGLFRRLVQKVKSKIPGKSSTDSPGTLPKTPKPKKVKLPKIPKPKLPKIPKLWTKR